MLATECNSLEYVEKAARVGGFFMAHAKHALRRHAAFCCCARRAIHACEPNTPCSSAGRVLTCATHRKTIRRPSIPLQTHHA